MLSPAKALMKKVFGLFILILCVLNGFEPRSAQADVLPGIHQLFSTPYFESIQNKRVAVIAHHASRTNSGDHLVDLLIKNKVNVTAIFAPEHGYRSDADDLLPDSKDPATGLPIFFLYGSKSALTTERLELFDMLIIDLQDVGLRYYTYATTIAQTLESCRGSNKKILILDRPNPIGGTIVDGAVLEESLRGKPIAYYPVPTRHGMTVGELALFFDQTFHLGLEKNLTIVPVQGWNRSMQWSETGLTWRAPSPALATFEQTKLYSIFGPLEALDLAVGRGQTNENAFYRFGAPWITDADANALAEKLNTLEISGLKFSPVSWTPSRREFEGKLCRGFEVRVTDKGFDVKNTEILLKVIHSMRTVLGIRLNLSHNSAYIDYFFGNHWIRQGLETEQSLEVLITKIQASATAFKKTRQTTLLYSE